MSKLFIVSTRIGSGKGGISTALIGYVNSIEMKKCQIKLVTSHETGIRLLPFFESCRVLYTECKKGDATWFHCGPWLSMLRKAILSVLAKSRGSRIYLHLHSPTLYNYLQSPFKRFFLKWLFTMADGLIVLTPWWREQVIQAFPLMEHKILVVPNPLDDGLKAMSFEPIKKNDTTNCKVRVLSMARLVKGKGFETVIDTFLHLPEHYTLTIAGDGPLMSHLTAQVHANGLQSRIKFVGWVDYDNKKALLRSHDVFCLPSKYDSFGMGFIEAMAAGLPVVALNFQAIPDVVPDGVAGKLVVDDHPETLCEAIKYCAEHQFILGKAGKEHVKGDFDAEYVSKKIIDFCNAGDKNEG
ncbi:glycosyltransferase family 4 protein [Colwellia sp. C1TZA3]|uniref:glycosyltransferase family 4 protein n=1 Tax=Colwellia sp. C1TZA3 TaxID=2508879 RepID=UPI0011B98A63|nr:glycosyltransferase family 4 protein [Colwellia sp. C1TZA3]TWX67494.1 glycosyltransferase family 4 protein [Colwellia sp. C1TZA3]